MMPHEVIAQIRREEYLLDVDASKEVLLGVKNLQRSLERALRLLSEDLYSKKTHFVLELIQNADDNQYKNGVKPKLRIQLSPSRLIVSNNETGFTEENVRALCRVGQSSKLKKDGYIGEKGIGFKSVFTVSDAPEIHSNGFHFRFDHINKERLLGYVIPNWYPATEPIDDSVTTIILPAKLGESFAAQTLVDLDPRLLLFLRKIRQFELQMPGSNSTFVRSSKGFDVQLTTALHPDEGDVQRNSFRYVRFASQISMSDIRDEKREGIEATELVVAFPIDDAGKAAPEPSCPTFAFLPIRSFGFKFCIQGDFLLSSSREDILTGRPWNLRLRDSIATTIIGAIENFKKSPALAFTYFKFLPDEQDITDAFFHPVVGQVIELLSQTPCIPSTGGEWLKPGEILSASSSFRNLFSANDVQELFGLDYPDARLEADAAMLARLGCKVLTFTDVVDIFKHHGEWLTQRNQEWLAQLYAYLADLNQALLLKSGLLKVPCIPISDGTFVIPSSANVFYPLSYKRKYGFEKELVIINQELLEQASKHSENVRLLFEKLGVKRDSPYDLVNSYVLPRHAGEAWKKSKHETLIGHLRYIKDKWPSYLEGAAAQGITESQAFETLRNGLWFGTKRKEEGVWYFGRSGDLYLGKEYEPGFCIETLLDDALKPIKIVSPDYLPKRLRKSDENEVNAELASWRNFLKHFGVSELPKTEKELDGNVKCSEELELLLGASQTAVRRAVLECIDRNWALYAGSVTYARFGKNNAIRETLFVTSLRSMIAPTRRGITASLSESYKDSPEFHDLFGDHPAYLKAKISNDGLLQACHVTFRIDASACIKRLKQLRDENLEISTAQLKRIYRQLENHWNKDATLIKGAFYEQALIRIKGDLAGWASPEDLTWSSSGPFLDSLYPPIQGQYHDLFSFFVTKLEIAKEISTGKMVGALTKLGELESRTMRAAEALRIYRRASADLTPRFGRTTVLAPDWLDTFHSDEVFLCRNDQFVANHEDLFVDDLPIIGALFADVDAIAMMDIPYEEIPRIRRLLEAVNVQFLSASLSIKVVDDQKGTLLDAITQKVQSAIKPVARLIYHHGHDRFETARKEGLFAKLREWKIVEVSQVQLKVTLRDVTRLTQGDIAVSKNRVLVRQGARSLVDRLASEICIHLRAPDVLSDAVSRLLLAENAEAAEDFLRVKGIGQLPSELEPDLAIRGNELGGEGLQIEPPETGSSDNTPTDEASYEGEATVDSQKNEDDASDPVDDSLSPKTVEGKAPTLTDSGESGTVGSNNNVLKRPPADFSGHVDEGKASTSTDSPGLGRDKFLVAGGHSRDEASQRLDPPPALTEGSSSSPETLIDTGASQRHTIPSNSGAGQPSASKRKSHRRSQRRTRSGRLLSYADSPSGDGADGDPGRAAAQMEVSKAAVKCFMSTQAHRWRTLEEMPHNNPGFDVKAIAHDGTEELVEVKGQSGAWTETGVILTPTELASAYKNGRNYWLCVVEFATDENRRQVHLVRNPFGLTQQFRYDSVWKSQAISESTHPLKPDVGLRVNMPAIGIGTILSFTRSGQFYKLHVQLDDGRQVFRLFNPATMKLTKT